MLNSLSGIKVLITVQMNLPIDVLKSGLGMGYTGH